MGSITMNNGDEAYNLFRRGKELLEEGNPAQAALVLEKAKSLEPDKGSILEVLGRAYYRVGDFDSAREQFEHAVQVDPTNDYAQFCLGLSLARLGLMGRARGHYKMALAMKPEEDAYREMSHFFEERE